MSILVAPVNCHEYFQIDTEACAKQPSFCFLWTCFILCLVTIFCFCSQKVVFILFSNFWFKYCFLPVSIHLFLFGDCFQQRVFIYNCHLFHSLHIYFIPSISNSHHWTRESHDNHSTEGVLTCENHPLNLKNRILLQTHLSFNLKKHISKTQLALTLNADLGTGWWSANLSMGWWLVAAFLARPFQVLFSLSLRWVSCLLDFG